MGTPDITTIIGTDGDNVEVFVEHFWPFTPALVVRVMGTSHGLPSIAASISSDAAREMASALNRLADDLDREMKRNQ